jgi:hypothetical protein
VGAKGGARTVIQRRCLTRLAADFASLAAEAPVMRTTAPPVVPFHFRSFESRAARSHHPTCRPSGPPPPAAPPRRSRPSRSSASRPLPD